MIEQRINPSHYNEYAIQPWDFITRNNIGYIEGNIIKYLCRYKKKDGLVDLMKAQTYLAKLIDDFRADKRAREEE